MVRRRGLGEAPPIGDRSRHSLPIGLGELAQTFYKENATNSVLNLINSYHFNSVEEQEEKALKGRSRVAVDGVIVLSSYCNSGLTCTILAVNKLLYLAHMNIWKVLE